MLGRLAFGIALAVGLGTAFLQSVNLEAASAATTCGKFDQISDHCPNADGAINGGGVDLSADLETGGGGGGEPEPNVGPTMGEEAPGGGGSVTLPDGVAGPDPIVRDDFIVNCIPNSPCDPDLVIRISDLVNFVPMTPTSGMEPNGWMVVGLPANFFASAEAHTRSGQLLGFPAEVRFTPVGYHWDFGDGSQATSASGGASWAAQGLAEFSPTATSHRFAGSGEYVITPSVEFAAAYRFNGGAWRNISGTLSVPAAPFTATAGKASTVLVGQDCRSNPHAPGC